MKPDLSSAIHLLHSASFGALATQASQIPGYPFATALPFVPDEAHRPVFLLSGLAEHTKNLLANPRASLLVTDPHEANVLEAPRMTLVGDVERFEAPAELQARYVRYHPDAAQYLELGDFAFFRLTPKRTRYIGGFGQMGWLEEDAWGKAQTLPLDAEANWIHGLAGRLPASVTLSGIDCYGVDLMRDGRRERYRLQGPLSPSDLIAGISRILEALPPSE